MPRLDDLEVEVLALIFEYVADSSANSALNFALTNKLIHATSKLVVHRRKTLFIAPNCAICPEVHDWLEDDNILRGLRDMTVDSKNVLYWGTEPFQNEATNWEGLVKLISRLGKLKTLTWNRASAIPLSVLNALHEHQKSAELLVYNFQRNEQTADEHDPAEIALAHSPALTAIRTQIWRNGNTPDLRRACFERIVANAPNLRFASISEGVSGCVVHIPTSDESKDEAARAKRFHTHPKPNKSLRRLTLDGYPLSESTLNEWARFVDLSQLENIKCSRGAPDVNYFTSAPKLLPNLKHLSLNLSYGGKSLSAAAENYLTTCSPLQSISLWSWMGAISLSTVLTRHGPSLETLHLHERETIEHDDDGSRKVLTAEDIAAIRETCAQLRDLSVDCDRHTRELDSELEVDDVIKELAKMKLAKLQIYYDLGIASLANPRYYSSRSPDDADDDDYDDNDDDSGSEGEDRRDAEDDTVAENAAANSRDGDHDSKRAKLRPEPIPPSTQPQMEQFVGKLWRFIFGSRGNSTARVLEVKFGEWERKMGRGYPAPWVLQEVTQKTRWIAKPRERDDEQDQCALEMEKGR